MKLEWYGVCVHVCACVRAPRENYKYQNAKLWYTVGLGASQEVSSILQERIHEVANSETN